jgi:short-subunit dehydrogenase involved in D-alanine esterification of teichoic acids
VFHPDPGASRNASEVGISCRDLLKSAAPVFPQHLNLSNVLFPQNPDNEGARSHRHEDYHPPRHGRWRRYRLWLGQGIPQARLAQSANHGPSRRGDAISCQRIPWEDILQGERCRQCDRSGGSFGMDQNEHSDCNALVNNAGIQRPFPLAKDTGSWEERAAEIEINLHAPIHLCTLFTPYFLEKDGMAILANVSSGLAFVPFTAGPVYSATKAAIHSFTMSLRYSLEDTNVRVIEIIPPAVKTNLGGFHDFGEDLDEYVNATMDRVEAGELEVGYKFSETARQADRAALDGLMENMTSMMHVEKYPAKK